ncbi:MAG: hypothetical protein ACJAW3_000131 [Lentimonas sp.]|jgi:hypothetical protein
MHNFESWALDDRKGITKILEIDGLEDCNYTFFSPLNE